MSDFKFIKSISFNCLVEIDLRAIGFMLVFFMKNQAKRVEGVLRSRKNLGIEVFLSADFEYEVEIPTKLGSKILFFRPSLNF